MIRLNKNVQKLLSRSSIQLDQSIKPDQLLNIVIAYYTGKKYSFDFCPGFDYRIDTLRAIFTDIFRDPESFSPFQDPDCKLHLSNNSFWFTDGGGDVIMLAGKNDSSSQMNSGI